MHALGDAVQPRRVGPSGSHPGEPYCKWLHSPVTKQMPMQPPSRMPTRAAVLCRGPGW